MNVCFLRETASSQVASAQGVVFHGCATFRAMQAAEEGPNLHQLEVVVNNALKQVLGVPTYRLCWGQWASIKRFGSRVYGLATDTSDADYWMPLPERHARAAKVMRAYCSGATLSFA